MEGAYAKLVNTQNKGKEKEKEEMMSEVEVADLVDISKITPVSNIFALLLCFCI